MNSTLITTTRTFLALLVGALATESLSAQPALVPDPSFQVRLTSPARWQSDMWKNWLVQPNGGIVLEGNFEFVRGQPRTGLARLHPDGRLDVAFNLEMPIDPDRDRYASQIAGVQRDSRLLVWGPATTGQGRKLLRLDASGRLDSTFQSSDFPGHDMDLFSVFELLPDDRLLFATNQVLSNGTWQLNILSSDGASNQSISVPFTGGWCCGASFQADGGFLITGGFTNISGHSQRYLARLMADGSLDTTFTPALPSAPSILVPQSDGKLLVANSAWTAWGRLLARLNSDGSLDESFNPPVLPRAPTSIIVQADGRVIIGGSPLSDWFVARLNGNGSLDPSFENILALTPAEIAAYLSIWLQPDGRIAIFGSAITKAEHAFLRPFGILLNPDGTLGQILHPPPQMFSPSGDGSFASAPFFLPGGKIIVGTFGRFGGLDQGFYQLIRLNGDWSLDHSFSLVFPEVSGGDVKILARSGDKVILGGAFTSVNGHFSPGVARLNADGSVDTNFVADPATPRMFAGVASGGMCEFLGGVAALPDGRLLVHGVAGDLVRLLSDGALDQMYRAPQLVGYSKCNSGLPLRKCIGLQNDGRLIVQRWIGETIQQLTDVRLARLSDEGAVDDSFAPIFRNPSAEILGYVPLIHALSVQPDDKIVVAGVFPEVNGVARYGLARLNADGSLDTSFDAGTTLTNLVETERINALAVDAEGRILVGGYFWKWLGKGLTLGLVRLNPNGSVDESFRADPASPTLGSEDGSRAVDRLQILSDGSILVTSRGYPGAAALLRTNGELAKLIDEPAVFSGSFNDVVQDARGGLLFAGVKDDGNGQRAGFLARHQFAPVFRQSKWTPASPFNATLGLLPGVPHRIEASSDLVNWQTVTSVTSATENLPFTDPEAGTAPRRYYRAAAENQ